MIFLISLLLTGAFVLFCGKYLKKRPAVFYTLFTALSLAVVTVTVTGARLPAWMRTWVQPVFSHAALAGAFFAYVMWAGALPNGTEAARRLMSVRGELSILACILTFAHNIIYGRTYFRTLFTSFSRLSPYQAAAVVCSLVLIAIMLPLFVTSFHPVRRRMPGRAWKRLQRLAYVFYALLYVHVMLLIIPLARAGRGGYAFNVWIYSAVFLGYAVCRILKEVARKTQNAKSLPQKEIAACLTVCVVSFFLAQVTLREAQSERASTPVPLAEEAPAPSGNSAASGAEPPRESDVAPPSAPALESSAAPLETEETPAATSATEEAKPVADEPAGETGAPSTGEEPGAAGGEGAEPPEEARATAAPSATPPLRYKNGTFTGSGTGYSGGITVSVTVLDDSITGIEVVSASDDEPYLSDAESVITRVLLLQTTSVDAVSGATSSSFGILDAIDAALETARN